jgi:DNA-binding NarL/FixJ family response regulator
MNDRLSGLCGVPSPTAKINACGYAYICWSNSKILRFLKTKAKEMNLPVLQRKWSNIDEYHISRTEIFVRNKVAVRDMLSAGLSKLQIAKKLNIHHTSISNMLVRFPDYFKGVNYRGKRYAQVA